MGQIYKLISIINDMTLKFIKNVTVEGKRKVINIPKKYHEKIQKGKKMLVSEIEYEKMTKKEMEELIEQ